MEVCKKARQKIGILYHKYYQHATPPTMLQLYLSCIRPDLEYACSTCLGPSSAVSNQFTGSCPEIRHECVLSNGPVITMLYSMHMEFPLLEKEGLF